MQPAGQDPPTERLESESTPVESDRSIDMYDVSR